MSATTTTDKAVYDLTRFGRFIVLISVILASTCYTATILVATTLLPQMQGGLSATQDEISWVMTFNILATAVATPMTGWLVAALRPAPDHDVVPRRLHRRDASCAGLRRRSKAWSSGASCRAASARR